MPHRARQSFRCSAVLASHAILSLCLLFAEAALPAAAVAAEKSSDASPIDTLALLESKKYTELERHYAARQRSYEDGAITEEALYKDFRTLYEDSVDNEQYFTGWVSAFPKSYSARMARGAYYYRMGWFVRGKQFISRTPRGQLMQMDEYLGKARDDLSASLKLSGRPYLSTLYLLNVSMLIGEAEETRRWLDVGTKLDPRNILLRIRYMVSLQPRWGGSHQQMKAFLDECVDQKLPQRSIARLELTFLREVADALSKDSPASERYEIWSKVRRAEQDAGQPASVEAVMRQTRAAWDLQRVDEANRGLQQLSRMNVEAAWVLSQMAMIHARQGRHKEAWPLLLKAAEKKDPWAQFGVGKAFYSGVPEVGIKPDQTVGLEWIRRAAAQQHAEAQAFLRSLN